MKSSKLVTCFIGAAILLAPFSAQPIGRSGNGFVASPEDGFKAELPKDFPVSEDLPNKGLRIISPFATHGADGSRAFVELHRFEVDFVDESKLQRADLRFALTSVGWLKASHSNPCIDVYYSQTASATAAIATWGNGKGFVIVGASNYLTSNSITSLLDTLTLEPGACAWK